MATRRPLVLVSGGLQELPSGDNIVGGKQTMYVPASAMILPTTSPAVAGSFETSTNKNNRSCLDFADAATKYAHFTVAMPKGWNNGTVVAEFYWTANSTSTNSVVWGIQGIAVSDNDALDAAFGTEQTVTDANGSTAYTLRRSAETSAITIGGTPAVGDEVEFRVYRKGADGSDNLAVDARLLGVKLIFTTSALTDE